ncbi:MAG: LON peptidase substrate-binding domain-containing protein, partial [Desulfovibrionaceae bacterium]|nr:LON peptidase substrate-binding domain-containing protein [Desulfovibrionaceae bacterium]
MSDQDPRDKDIPAEQLPAETAPAEGAPFREPPGHSLPTDIPPVLPVLPVRDVVIFNYMMLQLFVGRESSTQAVDAALNGNRYLFILTQKDESVENPGPEDLHQMGTVVGILRMLKMPDGRMKIVVHGITRARAVAVMNNGAYLECRAELTPERAEHTSGLEVEALMDASKAMSEKILNLRGINSQEINQALSSVDHPGRLADIIASNLRLKIAEAQEILDTLDPV